MVTDLAGIMKGLKSHQNGKSMSIFYYNYLRHRWLHYMTDETPIVQPPERQAWMLDHQENLTLEEQSKYIPYSTTKPKIEAWSPK